MKKSVLVLLALLVSVCAHAVEPFTISDIRVEGLERLDAGTVFNYLPLKVGDEMNDEEGRLGIRGPVRNRLLPAMSSWNRTVPYWWCA